ncbi:MAG: hypothetical protein AAB531_04815 [Patescibacteria group bacterium]
MGIRLETLQIERNQHTRGESVRLFAEGDQESPGRFRCVSTYRYEKNLSISFSKFAYNNRMQTAMAVFIGNNNKPAWFRYAEEHPQSGESAVQVGRGREKVFSIWERISN